MHQKLLNWYKFLII